MYLKTTYKAFVAQTAAKLMTEMVGQAVQSGKINLEESYKDNENTFDNLAWQASCAAEKLADTLRDRWTEDDGTVFFDVQDSPTSRIENELYNIAEKLDKLADNE